MQGYYKICNYAFHTHIDACKTLTGKNPLHIRYSAGSTSVRSDVASKNNFGHYIWRRLTSEMKESFRAVDSFGIYVYGGTAFCDHLDLPLHSDSLCLNYLRWSDPYRRFILMNFVNAEALWNRKFLDRIYRLW